MKWKHSESDVRYHTASLRACMAAAKAHELYVLEQRQSASNAAGGMSSDQSDLQAYGARAFTKRLAECLQARGVLQHFTPPR